MRRATLAIAAVTIAVVLAFVVPATAGHVPGCAHRPTVYTGTSGADCASDGAAANNVWALRGGNDEAHGDNGADDIQGEGGDDVLHGGNGGDELRGGDGHDRLYEFDPFEADNDNDRIFGDNGDDYVECGGGADLCRGGGQTVGGEDVLFHCHNGGEADDLGGFEQHIHTDSC